MSTEPSRAKVPFLITPEGMRITILDKHYDISKLTKYYESTLNLVKKGASVIELKMYLDSNLEKEKLLNLIQKSNTKKIDNYSAPTLNNQSILKDKEKVRSMLYKGLFTLAFVSMAMSEGLKVENTKSELNNITGLSFEELLKLKDENEHNLSLMESYFRFEGIKFKIENDYTSDEIDMLSDTNREMVINYMSLRQLSENIEHQIGNQLKNKTLDELNNI